MRRAYNLLHHISISAGRHQREKSIEQYASSTMSCRRTREKKKKKKMAAHNIVKYQYHHQHIMRASRRRRYLGRRNISDIPPHKAGEQASTCTSASVRGDNGAEGAYHISLCRHIVTAREARRGELAASGTTATCGNGTPRLLPR